MKKRRVKVLIQLLMRNIPKIKHYREQNTDNTDDMDLHGFFLK